MVEEIVKKLYNLYIVGDKRSLKRLRESLILKNF